MTKKAAAMPQTPDDATDEANGSSHTATRSERRFAARQREQSIEISRLCRSYGHADLIEDFLERDLTVDEACRELLELRKTDTVLTSPGNPLEASGGATRKRVIASEYVNERGEPVPVLSRGESMRELYANPEGLTFGGFVRAMVVPEARTAAYRRAMGEGSDSAGGYLVPPQLTGELVDALRNQAKVVEAGARVMPVNSPNMRLARLEKDPVAAWHAENEEDIAESTPEIGAVHLRARTLLALVRISRELMQDAPNIESVIKNAIAQALGLKLDAAALYGDGSALAPLGIARTTGVGAVSMGTNGAALTSFTPFNQALYAIAGANGAEPKSAIMSPRTKLAIDELKDTTGQPLAMPKSLAGLGWFATNQVPINEKQGTATNASRVFVGDFSKLIIGVLESVTVEILREAFYASHEVGIKCSMRADVVLERPQHLAMIQGIIP